jgi:spore coat polysaccharide biosynthesis predicted glycosyltransferase SpsG
MLVDGYELMDAATLNDMRSVARPVVCIVDHIPPQIDVDLTINPGADPVESGAGHLSGFECALVDPAFADVLPSDGAEVARLLVALGRTDICGASPKVVRALTKATFPSSPPAVTVVLGSNSPLLDDVRGALADYPGSGALCVDEADMVTQFAEADAVVVAGGVSLLECLAAGRPNCVVQTADNQSGNVRQAVSQGGSIDGGDISEWDETRFIAAIEALCSSAATRTRVAANARRSVDGKGAERVAKAMLRCHEMLWRQ